MGRPVRWVISFVAVAVTAFAIAGIASAQSSNVCADVTGAARGLCNAYCIAQNCPGGHNGQSCDSLSRNWQRATGQVFFPCDLVCCECPGAVGGCVTARQCRLHGCAVRGRCINGKCPTRPPTPTPTPSPLPTATPTSTPPALPCENSAPQCGGTCPSPLVCTACTDPAACPLPCVCQPPPPPPCENSAPQCGGTCPSPLVCTACTDPAACPVPCVCQPPPLPCNFDANHVCGGICPPGSPAGSQCGIDATGACTCVPPTNPSGCNTDPASGACGGTCPAGSPPGSVCGFDTSNNCTCLSPPAGCGPGTTPNTCNNGACPAPETCQLITTGTAPSCGCK